MFIDASKVLTALCCIFLSLLVMKDVYAGGTVGSCEYGTNGSNIYIRGGDYVDLDSLDGNILMSGEAYRCGSGLGLALLRINILFTEFAIFAQHKNGHCHIREFYVRDEDNTWYSDPGMDFMVRAMMSEKCN